MKNKYKLPEEVLETLADIGYTAEILEDYIIDKMFIQSKKHTEHLRGQLKNLREMLIIKE